MMIGRSYVIGTDGSGEDARHTRDPARRAARVSHARSNPRRDRRTAASSVVSLRSSRDDAHASLSQQHGPDDRTRVFVDAKYLTAPKVLIAAERDGDTVSPERGVYVMDLSRRVTRDELRERVKTNLDSEQTLVAKGKRLFCADCRRRESGGRRRVGRAYLQLRKGALRFRFEVRDAAGKQARGRVLLRSL